MECCFLPRSARESPISKYPNKSRIPFFLHTVLALLQTTRQDLTVPFSHPKFHSRTIQTHVLLSELQLNIQSNHKLLPGGSTSKISAIVFFNNIPKLDSCCTIKTPNTHHKAKQRVVFWDQSKRSVWKMCLKEASQECPMPQEQWWHFNLVRFKDLKQSRILEDILYSKHHASCLQLVPCLAPTWTS